MSSPMVSICSITYNHAPFIRQCLDGFLMQQCNFPIEIIINDDCSTDGTTEIIREYAEKYPDKIFPIFHEENLYSQGVRGMFQKFVFPKARGKYIALCEGDDYWTDPLKLQKQVDFLESHPDYSMCCHAVQLSQQKEINVVLSEHDIDLLQKDIIINGGSYIGTNSIVFKSSLHESLCSFSENAPVGDYPLQMWCSMNGKVRFMSDVMSIYNQGHVGSWTSNTGRDDAVYKKFLSDLVSWMNSIKNTTKNPFASRLTNRWIDIAIGGLLLDDAISHMNPEKVRWNGNVHTYLRYLSFPQRLRLYIKIMMPVFIYKLLLKTNIVSVIKDVYTKVRFKVADFRN